MIGPGIYDPLCTAARKSAKAEGCVLIILGGELGSSFCIQGSPEVIQTLPAMLRTVADAIESDLVKEGRATWQ